MNIKDIKKAIKSIEDSNDPEVKHGIEDNLYIDFIKHVADSGGELADLAKEVLKVDEMQFDRWYA